MSEPRLQAFARYWGFEPRACQPYRARTKGKDERSVGYIKRNALAGYAFASWGELDRHLATWLDGECQKLRVRLIPHLRWHGDVSECNWLVSS